MHTRYVISFARVYQGVLFCFFIILVLSLSFPIVAHLWVVETGLMQADYVRLVGVVAAAGFVIHWIIGRGASLQLWLTALVFLCVLQVSSSGYGVVYGNFGLWLTLFLGCIGLVVFHWMLSKFFSLIDPTNIFLIRKY